MYDHNLEKASRSPMTYIRKQSKRRMDSTKIIAHAGPSFYQARPGLVAEFILWYMGYYYYIILNYYYGPLGSSIHYDIPSLTYTRLAQNVLDCIDFKS